MPRHTMDEADWEEESSDDDGEPNVPCPYCRRDIPEDAPRCPYCENYVSAEDAPPSRKPWWVVLGVLVCLYFVYRWIVG